VKILHVIHGYFDESRGGTESYVRELLAEQRRHDAEVLLLTGSMHPWETCGIEEQSVDGVRVLRVHRDDWYFDLHSKAYHPGVERLVRDVLERERPDLLHVHQWIRLTSNLLEIADDFGIPAVVTLHDLYTSCPRAFRVDRMGVPCFRPLSVASCLRCVPGYGHESDAELAEGIELHHAQYQSELGRARCVLVPSPRVAEMIANTTGFPLHRFTILPLAYRPRLSIPVSRTPLPNGGEPFRFAYWGNVTERKGVHVLLEAVRALTARGAPRPFELHVFGGIDTDALRARLLDLAEDQPVVLHGRYDYEQLAAARLHMAVFPMVCFETFGFVLDEAVELRMPSIVTDIGAMPERGGAAVIAVPPGDVEALSRALEEVLARPALRDELAARLPALPPAPPDHARALLRIYDRARTAPPLAAVHPVDPLRRAAFAVMQRESALRSAHPEGKPY
jgi:glycosyltransferase involved in cell wall biosynthesis